MGKCCRAEYICGLTEFIEDVVGGGGGGGGTPGAPVNSVQYNSAGAFAGDSAFTYSGTALALTGTGSALTLNRSASALTTSLPALSITQTWNAVGTTFTGAVINVTDTASAAGSLLADLQVGGSTKFNVNKAGNVVSAGTIAAVGSVSGTKFTASNTVTADSPAFDAAQTWNNAGVTFSGMKLNITDTASNAASKLLDLQVGGSSRVNATKDALTSIIGTSTITGSLLSVTRSGEQPLLDVLQYGAGLAARKVIVRGEGLYACGDANSNQVAMVSQYGIRAASSLPIGWSSSATDVITVDTSLYRDAADTIAQRRGTNRQTYCIYNTYNGTNDEFLQLRFNGSNVAEIHTVKTGAGIARALSLGTGGVERLNIAATGLGTATFTGVVIAPSLIGSQAGASGAAVNVSSNTGFIAFGAASDVGLSRLGAGILGITNGSTGPGKLAIDKVQGTPFERLKMEWDTTNHVARIGTEKGTGGTARDLAFITDDQVRMTVYGAGGLNVAGGLTAWSLESTSGPIRITTSTPPASSGAAGNAGQITWDSDYLYVAVGSSSWKRIALSTF